jgi:hypothetical protein
VIGVTVAAVSPKLVVAGVVIFLILVAVGGFLMIRDFVRYRKGIQQQ